MKEINGFAAAVHRRRRERGLSLAEVAALTNYSTSYLSKVLHGHRRLLPAVVAEIDKALHTEGELERIAQAQTTDGTAPARPMQLPHAATCFVGREDCLHRMDAALVAPSRPGSAVAIVIEGGFGVGKTELAVQWAARTQGRFPGGCLFADMRGQAPDGTADPGEVLDAFLRTLGAGAAALRGSVSDRAARYRSLLAERPAIVVLDDIASYEQVQHLLPGAGSTVVATSREHQSALLLRTGGLHLEVPPLATDAALGLLRHRVGDARVNVDPGAATTVVTRCGRLPMAVIIAAEHGERRHQGSLDRLAKELATEAQALDVFTSVTPTVDIHESIGRSYFALPSAARKVFRLLGISPAQLISAESTAALAGLDATEARAALDLLRHAHLLELVPPGRMRMNHLLRVYAHQRAVAEESVSDIERACDRVLRWYLTTAWAANDALAPNWCGTALALGDTGDITPLTFPGNDCDAAIAWCTAEVDTAIHIACHIDGEDAYRASWVLPSLFLPYFHVSKDWGTWLSAATESLGAAHATGSREGIAWSLHSLGWAHHELGHTGEALTNLRDALQLRTELGDDRLRGWVSFSLGSAYLAVDRRGDALDYVQVADGIFTALDFDFGLAFTRAGLARIHQKSGDTDAANRLAHEALTHAQKTQSTPVISWVHHQFGLVLQQQHRLRAALTQLDAALTLRRRSRERGGEADTLIASAEIFAELNDSSRAQECYFEAAAILESLRDPRALDVRTRIAALNARLRSREHA